MSFKFAEHSTTCFNNETRLAVVSDLLKKLVSLSRGVDAIGGFNI